MRYRCLRAGLAVASLAYGAILWAQQPETANPTSDSSASVNSAVAAPAGATVVPRLISFGGTLKDMDAPAEGVSVTFSLYSLPDGSAPLWAESQKVNLDAQGHYTVMLGAASPNGLPLDLFTSGKALWLGVQPQISGAVEQPRVLLVAVPYALKAADADTLGGKPASSYLTADSQLSSANGSATGTTSPSQPRVGSGVPRQEVPLRLPQPCSSVTSDGKATANSIAMFTAPCNIENSPISVAGANVGISASLEVNGTAQFDGTVALESPTQGLSASYSGIGRSYYMWQVSPGITGAGPFARGFITIPFNGTPDPSTSWGYNFNPNGSQIVSGEPTWGWALEANYNDGTRHLMETYLQYSSANGQTFLRPFYANVDRSTNASQIWLEPEGGSVGVGTANPQGLLDVDGTNTVPAAATPGVAGQTGLIVWPQAGGPATPGSNSQGGNGGGVTIYSGAGGTSDGTSANSNGGNITLQVGPRGTGGSGGGGSAGFVLLNPSGGRVGIGTSNPRGVLDIESAGNNMLLNGGNVGIGTTNPSALLEVSGTAKFDQAATFSAAPTINTVGANILVGQSNGANEFRVDNTGKGFFDGGTQTGGADFAESVAVRGRRSQYQPGDVLEIDPQTDRHLALSHHAYSTLVAGIYSTKPGVLATPRAMDDPEIATSEVPLAVVGIVPCKVTAENGAIVRGDLLVTSSRAGYAMKGTDRQRMLGAVVGKALESLPDGTGVIQVLVTLQ